MKCKQGKPFVGPSGKLLDAVFEHVGIDPTEVYRTNAVMCRPPDNKLDKYQGAIKACSKRLEAELAALECDTIVALGNSAVQSLDMLGTRKNT
jgi:uracil-DNA glycosylase family 4